MGETIVIGEGELNWNRYERIGDRYGTVMLYDGDDDADPRKRFAEFADPAERIGTLRAEVIEGRQSRHIGDLAYGIGPDGPPEAGLVLELGHGSLFVDDRGIGIKPDRELAMEGLHYTGDFKDCEDCGGSGYGPEAQQIADTFYCLSIADRDLAKRLSWRDKIGQAEVDNLIEQGRLSVWRHCPNGCDPTAEDLKRQMDESDCDWCGGRGAKWVSEPRTAAEINALNRSVGMDSHDGINRMILIEFRCKQLGIELSCSTCGGHGDLPPEGVERGVDRPLPADRDTWWLNVPVLYRLHESVVRLTFEED